MSNKKFIGYGFPGIKECINEKNILTKQSTEKREFSVRKLIPISQILVKQTKNTQNTNLKTYDVSESDDLNIVNNIQYNPIENFLHNSFGNVNVNKSVDIDLKLINAPIHLANKRSTKRSSNRSTKRSTKRSNKRSNKRSTKRSNKRSNKKTSKKQSKK